MNERLVDLLDEANITYAYSLHTLPEQEYEVGYYVFFRVLESTYVFAIVRGKDEKRYDVVDCHPDFVQALKIAQLEARFSTSFRPSDFLEREGKEA